MTILTIYNHGTGGSSMKGPEKAEIVNLFGNNDRSLPFQGKVITEGVGSIGDPQRIALAFSRDPGGGPTWMDAAQHGRSSTAGRAFNAGVGHGVQQNVESTVEFIRMLNLNNQLPSTLNMLGWSRGAVTCIRIAWSLYQSQDPVLRKIPINIFAVDPVAGAGHSNETDATTLTPNVRNYMATLATGERRRFFKPIAGHRLHVEDPHATCTWVLPVPGHHSDTAKMNNNVGEIVFNLAYRFLHACGTQVPAMRHYRLSNGEAWKKYEQIMVGQAKVHTTSLLSRTAMGGIGYSRGGEATAHAFGEDFFPNIHARLLFMDAYPMTYDAYFVNGRALSPLGDEWEGRFGQRVRAEQARTQMPQALVLRLDALGGRLAAEPNPDTGVEIMLNRLALVD
ncbi:hypothetical protein ACDH70_01075 [Xanthomonas axonopodis pv. poinsettiicola]|uniref:hypothetical protein n=1 Tax=Xanthomonas TaxID=338 RepID=UPI001E62A1D9|nr:hypothetical protein [Xanthomonas codiaei]MCC8536853.1 hypothetical protein [Xanthomonas codiaei]